MKDHLQKLKCLSDETRVRILRVLLEAGRELCVCEIVDALDVAVYSVSKHMKELRQAGLIDEGKDGKFVMCGLAKDRQHFDETLLQLIREIPDDLFTEDRARLKSRLSIRKENRCVVGMKG